MKGREIASFRFSLVGEKIAENERKFNLKSLCGFEIDSSSGFCRANIFVF
jgi:hypothetical protein